MQGTEERSELQGREVGEAMEQASIHARDGKGRT
jgi:hypothetical protein